MSSSEKEPRDLGRCSPSRISREIMDNLSSGKNWDFFKFENKTTQEIYTVQIKIDKIDAEVYIDDSGKVWKRIG